MLNTTSEQLDQNIKHSIFMEILARNEMELLSKYIKIADEIYSKYTNEQKRQALTLILEGATYGGKSITYLQALEIIDKKE